MRDSNNDLSRRRFLRMTTVAAAGLAAWTGGYCGFSALCAENRGIIDIHNHLHGAFGPPGQQKSNFKSAVKNTLRLMDQYGIDKVVLMPPPFPPGHRAVYQMKDLLEYIRPYPDRFRWMGGGGGISPALISASKKKSLDSGFKDLLRKHVDEVAGLGAVGLGEFASEHYGLGPGHKYINAEIDHQAFLLLADLAAEYSLPIDLHMEAVDEEIPLPGHLKSPPNPKRLKPNIPSLENFLAHNRKARIIWSHVGWCNTGRRTPALIGSLIEKHPNLYLSFKISPIDSLPQVRPLEKGGKAIKAEWLTLLRAYRDRFLIGSDQFFTPFSGTGEGRAKTGGKNKSPDKTSFSMKKRSDLGRSTGRQGGKTQIGPESLGPTMKFYSLLPSDLAGPIGRDNAVRLFKI